MKKIPDRFAILASTVALMALAGCGDGKPSVSTSTAEATVKGTVIIRGKPATKGVVEFDPANHLRKDAQARTTTINPDGTYSIKTLVGGNTVRVRGPDAEKASSAYDTYDLDVQPGEVTYDIKLPKK